MVPRIGQMLRFLIQLSVLRSITVQIMILQPLIMSIVKPKMLPPAKRSQIQSLSLLHYHLFEQILINRQIFV